MEQARLTKMEHDITDIKENQKNTDIAVAVVGNEVKNLSTTIERYMVMKDNKDNAQDKKLDVLEDLKADKLDIKELAEHISAKVDKADMARLTSVLQWGIGIMISIAIGITAILW